MTRSTKHSFWLSVVSLLLCFSMLLGSTWAWFTDSVTSTGNIIKSGTLDVTLEWMEGNLNPADKDSAEWIDASSGAIFYSELWEPGYTEVKHIKIENEGSLALKYVLDIIPYDEDGNVLSVDALEIDGVNLAKAIDVYYVDPAMQITDRDALDSITPMCTLYDALVNLPSTGNGKLLAGELDTVTLALKMQESAGNEYQNKSIGASFAIRLMATQYTKEADSFDESYDTDSKWPIDKVVANDSVSSSVTTVDNKVTNEVTLNSTSGKLSATLPEGVLLDNGASSVTLTISDVEESEANITLSETEATLSLDVHIEGISENNDKVIKVDLAELLPVGLNMGNYRFYHVENGTTVEMTLLEAGNTPVHNNYTYDPATGNVTLYLKSFSEIALVADTENAWEGNFDYDWYNADATELTIANADQLAAFGAIVGGMNGQTQDDFSGKTVTLISDINLGDAEKANNPDIIFYPIGYYNSTGSYERCDEAVTSNVSSFEGTFDGNGHTISNFYQNTWGMFGDYNDGYSGRPNYYDDAMGLFGYVKDATVKNLTVNNFSSDGEFTPTGVIAAYATNSTFENIAITNCNPRVYNTGNGGIVGIGGNNDDPENYKLTFKNVTIDNTNKITALWGSWDVACGGLVGMFRGAGHVYMTNCHVAAQIDAYNDVCGNYQYYWYRYSGMLVGTNKNMTTDTNGYTVPETSKYHAENCTVHFDKWNDYYYCELVANSLASYTHDHQFSRLVMVDKVDPDAKTVTVNGVTTAIPESGRYNYGVLDGNGYATSNVTCYHFVDDTVWNHEDAGTETVNGETVLKENNQHIYLPFNQLFTGYGWGVKHIPVGAFDGVTILDREVADSQTKFDAFFEDNVYRIGDGCSVTVGELFAAVDGMNINTSGVWVSVEAVDSTDTVTGKYVANSTDWRDGTLTFNGTGVAKITIQDYDYCIPTVLYISVEDVVVGADSDNLKIVGLSADKSYQYARVNDKVFGIDDGAWTDVEKGSTEFTVSDIGLWAVRIAGSTDEEKYDYILVGETEMNTWYIDSGTKKKKVYTAVSKDWVIGKWSSDLTTFGQPSSSYATLDNAVLALAYTVPTEKDVMFEYAHDKLNYKYALNTDGIVPVKELNKIEFHFNANPSIANLAWECKTAKDFVGTIRIYVVDSSDVEYYEVPFNWGQRGESLDYRYRSMFPVTVDFQTALTSAGYENPNGYVIGISILPWGGVPSDWGVQNDFQDGYTNKVATDTTTAWGSRSGTQLLYYYDMTTIECDELLLSLTGDAYDDKYEITGFDPSLSYSISTDLINYRSIGSGFESYKVSDIGTYYFKADATSTTVESKVATVVINGSIEDITNLETDENNENIVTGFESGVVYEWAKYTHAGYGEWTQFESTDSTTIELTAGLTAVRYPANGTLAASKPQFFYKAGENVGSIGLLYDTASRKPVEGKWINKVHMYINSSSKYTLTGTEYRSFGLTTNYFDMNSKSVKDNYYIYSLADDEIISLNDIDSTISITIRPAWGQNNLFTAGTAKGKVRFHVVGGTKEYYDYDFDTSPTPANVTATLKAAQGDIIDGYLTGISVWPIYEVTWEKSVINLYNLLFSYIEPVGTDSIVNLKDPSLARINLFR